MAYAKKKQEEAKPEEDTIKQYLIENFGNLIEQVGDGYGKPLQDELFRRLEKTIADFDEEVNELINELKDRSERRHEKLIDIWQNEQNEEEKKEQSEITVEEENTEADEVSEWEKRLESKTAQQQSTSTESEKPKKKGLFGRKK